jgi:hypothetical protein
MSSMHDDELTREEIEALRGLPREARPSDLLEERTVRALAQRGRIHRRRALPTPLAWSAAAAACLLFFVAGFAVGQSRGPEVPADGARMAPEPTNWAGPSRLPDQDSTDVTFADPTAKRSSGVQHVVWF